MKRLLLILAGLVFVIGLSAVVPLAGAGPVGKVDVCHHDADSGTFHKISISGDAFDTHVVHGDAAPLEPVPGMPGHEFGEDCSIIALAPAEVEVIKDLYPLGVGVFDLQINGTTYADDVGDGGTTGPIAVPGGSVTVSELAGADTDLADYASSVWCDNGDSADPATSLTLSPLSAGDQVTCTFANELKLGSITVQKLTVGGVGCVPEDPQQLECFIFTTDYLVGPIELTTGEDNNPASHTTGNLTAGRYSVTELGPDPDWQFYGVFCTDDDWPDDADDQTATIELDPGENVTCTFTNIKK